MDLVEFIDKSNNSECIDDLVNCFSLFLAFFGIRRFVMSDVLYLTFAEETSQAILVRHPRDDIDYCLNDKNLDYDQVYKKVINEKSLFTWSILHNEKPPHRTLKVTDPAVENNFCGGIYIPVHQPLGKTIGMGLSSSENTVRCDKNSLSQISAASQHFFITFSRLSGIGNPETNKITMSEREKEILLWIARGKSKSETADILSISESSVKRHCEKIFIKLNVNTLPSAVARAMNMGFINLFSFLFISVWPFSQLTDCFF